MKKRNKLRNCLEEYCWKLQDKKFLVPLHCNVLVMFLSLISTVRDDRIYSTQTPLKSPSSISETSGLHAARRNFFFPYLFIYFQMDRILNQHERGKEMQPRTSSWIPWDKTTEFLQSAESAPSQLLPLQFPRGKTEDGKTVSGGIKDKHVEKIRLFCKQMLQLLHWSTSIYHVKLVLGHTKTWETQGWFLLFNVAFWNPKIWQRICPGLKEGSLPELLQDFCEQKIEAGDKKSHWAIHLSYILI